MKREIKNLVYKAIEEYKEVMNKYDFDSYERYDRMNRLCSRILNDKMERIYSDLRACVRCGFISEEEVIDYIKSCKSVIADTKRDYVFELENRLGEEEFNIQWLMINNDYSREQAEKFYFEYYAV